MPLAVRLWDTYLSEGCSNLDSRMGGVGQCGSGTTTCLRGEGLQMGGRRAAAAADVPADPFYLLQPLLLQVTAQGLSSLHPGGIPAQVGDQSLHPPASAGRGDAGQLSRALGAPQHRALWQQLAGGAWQRPFSNPPPIPRPNAAFHLHCSWGEQLRRLEFQELIMFLQRPPTVGWGEKDIELVLSRAYMWRASFKGAASHFS